MWQTEKIQGVEAVLLKSFQKWNSWKHAKRHHSFTICFSLIYGTFASTKHLFDSSGPVKVHSFQQHKALEPHILQDLVQFQLNDAFHIYIIVFSHEIVPQFLYYVGNPLLFHSGILGFSMVSLASGCLPTALQLIQGPVIAVANEMRRSPKADWGRIFCFATATANVISGI